MFIRKATAVDVSQLVEIQRICQLEIWKEVDLQTELKRKDSLLLVVSINKNSKQIIGMAAVRFSGLGVGVNGRMTFSECDLINIGVPKEYRKQGIGTQLLKELVCQAKEREVESVWLEVRESNLDAISFYEKNGFCKAYVRKNFYTSPADNAVVMKFDMRTV